MTTTTGNLYFWRRVTEGSFQIGTAKLKYTMAPFLKALINK
jgi:hypothetical protein